MNVNWIAPVLTGINLKPTSGNIMEKYIVQWTSLGEDNDLQDFHKYYVGRLDWSDRAVDAFKFTNKQIAKNFIEYDAQEYDFQPKQYTILKYKDAVPKLKFSNGCGNPDCNCKCGKEAA